MCSGSSGQPILRTEGDTEASGGSQAGPRSHREWLDQPPQGPEGMGGGVGRPGSWGLIPPHPQEKVSQMKANEVKLESDKRRLKEVLDASESRTIKLELQRRSLEGELQRSRLGLGDREAQAQVLQDRVDFLQRQVGPHHRLQAPHLHAQHQVLYTDPIILPATL